ncbi:MAG: hypothetical protein P4M11_15480 [Candidatus Pacebacteria bacterium]|nr:hypothetical protein [Candidatus Paceibacterota bacterium]
MHSKSHSRPSNQTDEDLIELRVLKFRRTKVHNFQLLVKQRV